MAKEAASDLGYDFIREGVYIVQAGPCYETIAECRYFRMIGADVTGGCTKKCGYSILEREGGGGLGTHYFYFLSSDKTNNYIQKGATLL